MKPNGGNERIKAQYERVLRDGEGKSEASIDGILAAIERFELYTRRRDFRLFRTEQVSAFKVHLAEQVSTRTGKTLSASTRLHTLTALRDFFLWLADKPGFRSRIRYSDARFFTPSNRDVELAKGARVKVGPTLEQMSAVLARMPNTSDMEKRNRALLAFALLTGMRDGALASVRLKHVNIADRYVLQDGREMRTKASKTIHTWFYDLGEEFVSIVREWVRFLHEYRQWGLDDPLFPRTALGQGSDRNFQPVGLARRGWRSAAPIRAIYKEAFERAGIPYFHPHLIRDTVVLIGAQRCRTPEEAKAWSLNMGHDKPITTFTSYGHIEPHRQRDLIRKLGEPQIGVEKEELEAALKIVRLARASAMTTHKPDGSIG
jgi:integrase